MKPREYGCLFIYLFCVLSFAEAHFSRCGFRNSTRTYAKRVKRVIGGNEAHPNSWPWMVNFIDEKNLQQCAGTIIDRQWILTAAHCFLYSETPKPLKNYTYHVADHRLNITDPGEYTIEPSQAFFHPEYIIGDGDGPGDYDIALLKLKKPLNFSEKVRPACLPEQNTSFSKDSTCFVVGWGNTINNSSYHRSSYLKEGKVDLVSLDQCNSNASYNGSVPKRFICAGFEKGGIDGCYGDSGGPLQCERNGTWTQIGIMIWGLGCAEPNHYGVYINIRVLLPFIRTIQNGPNINLTMYYEMPLMEIKPNMTRRGMVNLHYLFTKGQQFSDIDLVRNLQLVPNQIKLLNKTNLSDLVFASNNEYLLENATTLMNITRVFIHQADRLSIYEKSKELARQLNITFDDVVKLSNLSKDELLNSKSDILDKLRKMFYINNHLDKLYEYKRLLPSHKDGIAIDFNRSLIKMDLQKFSLEKVKKLDGKYLKQILVKYNRKFFTKITIKNISTFFETGSTMLMNMTVNEVLVEILNISLADFAFLHQLKEEDLEVVKILKISSVSNSIDLSLYEVTNAILRAHFSRCGFRKSTRTYAKRVKRVIGGNEAHPNSWPWMVNFIDEKNLQRCAGTIIDRQWIVTAAHCFLYSETPKPLKNYTYHVADHWLNITDPGEYTIEPSQAFFHPKYIIGDGDGPGDYDIALLKLKKPLNFSEKVRPACLPEQNTSFSKDSTCFVVGWGNTINNSSYHRSSYLKEGKVDLVSLDQCNSNASYNGSVSKRFLCAGFEKGGIDGCYGDSGGPLQCERNGTWTQIGIMIWGLGCAEPNHYGVYIDIRVLLPFIRTIQNGPNINLTMYYEMTLMEIKPNMTGRGMMNLHYLFTKGQQFSDIDLVRNLQLVPNQIKLLNKTNLSDLVFVSNTKSLLENATTLMNITRVFFHQADRLSIYEKSKELARQLNLTFDDVVKLSNLSKDELLNSKSDILDKLRKMFYINNHLDKLYEYKRLLPSYKGGIGIVFNRSLIKMDLQKFSLDKVKKLDGKFLKQILVKYNRKFFTMITFKNISTFFETGTAMLMNMTFKEVLVEILNISLADFASLHQLKEEDLEVVKIVKISSVSSSIDLSLYEVTKEILHVHFSRCGFRNSTQTYAKRVKRVIGGNEAHPNSWPWMVNFIDEKNLQQCAGTIIDRQWILTAAHCFLYSETPKPLKNYTYHVADHWLKITDSGEYTIEPSQAFFHPKYIIGDSDDPGDYDIGLLKLKKPLIFNDKVRPACLPEQNTNFSKDSTCFVVGWGNTINNSSYHRSSYLKEAKVDLVSLAQCNSNASYNGTVPKRFVCAGFRNGGVDGCYGDSGGPLQCERNGIWTQIGIMIWGIGCAEPNHYGVYTDIRAFLPFIRVVQQGPNNDLTMYYKKTLKEINPNMTGRGLMNLHYLFTKQKHFSDIDLVRNLQLVPNQIKLLNKTNLSDLVFVSNTKSLLENATTLMNITRVFFHQTDRLSIYEKSKELARQLNITFDDVVKLSNLSKDELLNSKSDILEKLRKMFYINNHLDKLYEYKQLLPFYKDGIAIDFNRSLIKMDLQKLSLEKVKKLDGKFLKQILVKYNRKFFTKITIKNISTFFETGSTMLMNMTVNGVLVEILNISLPDFASLHQLKEEDLEVVKIVKISSVSNSVDLSLYEVTKAILQAHFSRCGFRNSTQTFAKRVKRVIGGNEAHPNSWPWMVNFIDEKNLQQCAGTIIDRQWILTAAHCFLYSETPKPLKNYTYHVADHRLNITDPGEYTIEPSQAFFHPKYMIGDSDDPGDYDIALLKLKKPLTFSKRVRPSCLPDENTTFSKDDSCFVVGWGNTINNSSYHRSSYLKEAKVDLVSLAQCNSNASYNGTVPKRFVCAGFQNGGVDGCYGDSGGPLQCERNGIWTQIGIMIWGIGCAEPNHYGVYTDIRAFLPFIRVLQEGPNINLTTYYKKSLVEIKPNMTRRGLVNLHYLLTKGQQFSDIDLVRNLQLVPNQIKLLNKTNLSDLVFVSNTKSLLENATTLMNITRVFIHQTDRLSIYEKSKELARQLNITFDDVVKLSNLSKDELLNSKSDILDKLRKMFYINNHLDKLYEYKQLLPSYKGGIGIVFNRSLMMMDLQKLSLEKVKKLDGKFLKQILVKYNRKFFTKITIKNISTFFETGTAMLMNMTFKEVLVEILNISLADFASLHQLKEEDLEVVKIVKISSVSSSIDLSLYEVTKEILHGPFTRCGFRNSTQTYAKRVKRVIGGNEAHPNSWPWMVNFIDEKNLQQCAGTIIDRQWILTAAHCFLYSETPKPLKNYTFHVADHRLNITDPGEYTIEPSQAFFHPKYIIGDSDDPGDYDIGLLKLKKPLIFNDKVRPACLPQQNTTFSKDSTCFVVGWGNTINNSSYHRSSYLKEAKVDLVSLAQCNSNASYNGTVPKRFVCAGFQNGGVDGCYGDSGGPLQCERNGIWTQIGIMIWGIGCAEPNHYGVYTDIRAFLPFIRVVQQGSNNDLTMYYKKTLKEINPNMTGRGLMNLHYLFTKQKHFSDIDLVRNLQLVPNQIKLLNKTNLFDLVFVSNTKYLLENATTLMNITRVFIHQADRLSIYEKSKELARQLNITFDDVVKLSNLSKDELLNSKSDILDKLRKTFYLNSHLSKLYEYEKSLLGYNSNMVIRTSKIKKYLEKLSLEKIKALDDKSLKQMLANENGKAFTEDITVQNISAFFGVELGQIRNMTIDEVLKEILNISLARYATLHQLAKEQLNVIQGVRLSEVSNPDASSIYGITRSILKSREKDECSEKGKCSDYGICMNFIGSFSCRCKNGYIGNGFECAKGNTMYKSTLVINQTFSSSLNDVTSYDYTNLKTKVENGISLAVRASSQSRNFLGTQVTGFRPGSVLADYVLVFSLGENDKINQSQLNVAISSAIRNGSFEVLAVSSEPLQKTDLCALGSHNCHKDGVCIPYNEGFTCKCNANFYGDGVSCVDPCAKLVCPSNSRCYRGLQGGAKCVCDPDFSEDDGKCKKNNGFKIYLIVVSCIAAVLLLVLLVILFYKYCGRRNKMSADFTKPESGRSNTGYDDINLENL